MLVNRVWSRDTILDAFFGCLSGLSFSEEFTNCLVFLIISLSHFQVSENLIEENNGTFFKR